MTSVKDRAEYWANWIHQFRGLFPTIDEKGTLTLPCNIRTRVTEDALHIDATAIKLDVAALGTLLDNQLRVEGRLTPGPKLDPHFERNELGQLRWKQGPGDDTEGSTSE